MTKEQAQIIGIVNITEDSFSDGGLYATPDRAIARALQLTEQGADWIDLGAAASNIHAQAVSHEEEVKRLAPVIDELHRRHIQVSVDTFNPQTQVWCLSQGVEMLNDINGFCHPEIYPDLAKSDCRLVVMHSVQHTGIATLTNISVEEAWQSIRAFFDARIDELTHAGVARERLIIDPGMGNFLSTDPNVSLYVLDHLNELKARYNLPLYIGLSRKGFLRRLPEPATEDIDARTAYWNAYAIARGADYIRTHVI